MQLLITPSFLISFLVVIYYYPPSSSSITPASHPRGKFGSAFPSNVDSNVEHPSTTIAALEDCVMALPEKRRRCSVTFPVFCVAADLSDEDMLLVALFIDCRVPPT